MCVFFAVWAAASALFIFVAVRMRRVLPRGYPVMMTLSEQRRALEFIGSNELDTAETVRLASEAESIVVIPSCDPSMQTATYTVFNSPRLNKSSKFPEPIVLNNAYISPRRK